MVMNPLKSSLSRSLGARYNLSLRVQCCHWQYLNAGTLRSFEVEGQVLTYRRQSTRVSRLMTY